MSGKLFDSDVLENLRRSKIIKAITFEHPLRFFKVEDFAPAGNYLEENRIETSWEEANVVSSRLRRDKGHLVILDIDCEVEVVPSSTPGHYHLYINKVLPWSRYEELLEILGRTGIIEPGYAHASIARGATFLRLPWVKKEVED